MPKYFIPLFFFASILSGQINHQEKLVIKRKLGQSTVTFDFDIRTNETGFFHKHLDVGFHYPIKPTWKVGLKYRAQYRFNDGEWDLEKRPQAELIKSIERPNAKWQLRTRMDYRIRNEKNDEMRSRSRIQWKLPKSFTRFKITPFFNNEFLFAVETWKYNQNRFSIGFDLPKSKIGKPTIFYKNFQTLKDGEWVSSYILVIKMAI